MSPLVSPYLFQVLSYPGREFVAELNPDDAGKVIGDLDLNDRPVFADFLERQDLSLFEDVAIAGAWGTLRLSPVSAITEVLSPSPSGRRTNL